MTRGKPDFFASQLPGMPAFADNQTAWRETDSDVTIGGATCDLINYTVPAGYDLHITAGVISVDPAGTHQYYLVQGVVLPQETFGKIIFTNNHVFQFFQSAGYVVPAGEFIKITCQNTGAGGAAFYATLTGYLEAVAA